MNKKLIFILSLLILSSVITTSVWAAATNTCYTFETGVPFIAGKGECKAPSGLANMIVSLIPILFRIAGVLAFVMIVYAGFQYATSGGDTSKQKDAQDRIINAIIGLVLLFAFYLIIYTINPDILNIQELSLQSVTSPKSTISHEFIDSLPGFTKICDGPLHPTPIPYSKEVLDNSTKCFYIKDTILVLLKNLYAKTGKTWVLTEACQRLTKDNPTEPCFTYLTHEDPSRCHETGDCVDLALNKFPSPTEQQEFIKLLNSVGLNVYNEYDENCKTSKTTGGHFHVSLSCGSKTSSCWFCGSSGGGTGGSAG